MGEGDFTSFKGFSLFSIPYALSEAYWEGYNPAKDCSP